MVYRIAAVLMILSSLQVHSPTTGLFICDLLYSCAAVDKISTDMLRPSMIAELLVRCNNALCHRKL